MNGPVKQFRSAFTLMEMVVSIGILVIVILSVGVIFQSAGRTVGVSQASMEMLSNVRSVQQQIERDLSGLDKSGFLVIRSSTFTDPTSNITRRGDMISFLSRGAFSNRTGGTGGLTDNNTIVPSALVWYGGLAIAKAGANAGGDATNPSVFVSVDQTLKVPLNQVPTGLTDSDFILGRYTTLLVPRDVNSASSNNVTPCGSSLASYPSSATMAGIDYSAPSANVSAITTEGVSDITQSRVSAAQCTSSQVMGLLMQAISTGGGRSGTNARYEADHFCYRHAALRSPYDSTISLINGCFRMHPIALPGVSSFAIEWTDGSVFRANDKDPVTGNTIAGGDALVGTTRWYGYGNPKGNTTGVDPGGTGTAAANGDLYCAIFSFDNRVDSSGVSQWPVALRFRYHVADPTGRLANGRDFVEIVKLPS